MLRTSVKYAKEFLICYGLSLNMRLILICATLLYLCLSFYVFGFEMFAISFIFVQVMLLNYASLFLKNVTFEDYCLFRH